MIIATYGSQQIRNFHTAIFVYRDVGPPGEGDVSAEHLDQLEPIFGFVHGSEARVCDAEIEETGSTVIQARSYSRSRRVGHRRELESAPARGEAMEYYKCV